MNKYIQKNRKELLILMGAIALTLLYLFIRNASSNISYQLPTNPFPSDQERVTEINITSPFWSVELKKEGELWLVKNEAGNWSKANQFKAKQVLKTLGEATTTSLTSTQENYTLYGLNEESRIAVTLFENSEELYTLYLGNFAGNSASHTYVQYTDDPSIYTVRGNLPSSIALPADEYKNKDALSFDSTIIDTLNIERNGVVHTWSKNSEDHTWSSETVASPSLTLAESVDTVIPRMGTMKVGKFQGSDRSYLGDPLIKGTFLGDDLRQTIELYEPTEEGYIATTSEMEEVVIIPLYMGDYLFQLAGEEPQN